MKNLFILFLIIVTAPIIAFGGGNGDAEDIPTLVWYNIGDTPVSNDLVNQKISDLVRDRIGANVEVRYIGYGDYSTKINTMLATGDDLDLVFSAEWAADFTRNAQDGYFTDLYEYQQELNQTIALVNPALKSGATIDGALYGISTNKEVGFDEYIFVVEEELDFLDGGNIRMPITDEIRIADDGNKTEVLFSEYMVEKRLDRVEPYLRATKIVYPFLEKAAEAYRALGVTPVSKNENLNNPDYVTLWLIDAESSSIIGSNETLAIARHTIGINAFNPEAEGFEMLYDKNSYLYDQLEETTRFVDRLVKNGVIRILPQGDTPFDGKSQRFLLLTRHAFPYWGAQLTNDFSSPGSQKTIRQINYIPAWIGGSDVGVVNAIPVQSQNKTKTAQFLELLNTDSELRTTVAYGVEGIHWNYIDYTDKATGQSFTASDKVYFERTDAGLSDYSVGVYTQGNFFILPLQKGEPANKWDVFLASYSPNTTHSLPYSGLNFSATSGLLLDFTSSDMQAATAVISTEMAKHNQFFFDTSTDFEEKWSSIVESATSESVQNILEEVNRQFREFQEKK